jgi:NAD(P)-dependent dehydrogenase (short-subunit alcohol dehydrogenase family)
MNWEGGEAGTMKESGSLEARRWEEEDPEGDGSTAQVAGRSGRQSAGRLDLRALLMNGSSSTLVRRTRMQLSFSTLNGKVALVTGAGSGIGAATAHIFAEAGARVALLSCEKEGIQRVCDEIRADGGESMCLEADVADAASMTSAVEQVKEAWGQLDIVFANAGINGVWAPLDQITPEEWDRTMNVNLRGTFLTVQAALPLLKVHGGSVIITSSVNGTRMFSNSGATAYACSKAAQVAFAKMIAVELAHFRIRVNVVCPGFIDTPIHERTERRRTDLLPKAPSFPDGPIPLTGYCPGQPEQVARQVLFFASDAADHITGSEVFIDGAQSLCQG